MLKLFLKKLITKETLPAAGQPKAVSTSLSYQGTRIIVGSDLNSFNIKIIIMKPKIIIHGGAEDEITSSRAEELEFGLRNAIIAGCKKLKYSAIDSVEAAILSMENSGLFNAGVGSFPNEDEVPELDAGIICSDGKYGSVVAVRNVKNTIKLAINLIGYCSLSGEGAEKRAKELRLYSDYKKWWKPNW